MVDRGVPGPLLGAEQGVLAEEGGRQRQRAPVLAGGLVFGL